MNRAMIMSQSFVRIRGAVISLVLLATVVVGGAGLSIAQQPTQPQPTQPQPPVSVHSIVAKQAALVSEFEVNGLKVLMKRREGSLTVAAGLFIRGGSANINAQNAGIDRKSTRLNSSH